MAKNMHIAVEGVAVDLPLRNSVGSDWNKGEWNNGERDGSCRCDRNYNGTAVNRLSEIIDDVNAKLR
jgi:hypothetical protein